MSESRPFEGPDGTWRQITLDDIPEAAQKLLINYSGLTRETILPHVLDIRDRAFKEVPWPCIGVVKFLDDEWTGVDYFEKELLPRLKAGATFLDAGCGFGQDLRYLVYDWGIDSSQLSGADLNSVLLDYGYELFRDKDKFKGRFLTMDLLDPSKTPDYEKFKGSFELIYASQLLHCFDWDDMRTIAKSLVGLSRGPGSIIAGYQMGSTNAGSYKIMSSNILGGVQYRHSEKSWSRFWQEIGKETGHKFEVTYQPIQSALVESMRSAWWAREDPGILYHRFTIKVL